MSKELNIIEVSKIKNAEFEIIFLNGDVGRKKVHTNGEATMLNTKNEYLNSTYFLINAKFIPIQKQKPITFMEAIKSGSRIRVEHELIDNFKPLMNADYLNDDYLESCCNILTKGGYLEINDFLSSLGYLFGEESVTKILTEGNFYIEEK